MRADGIAQAVEPDAAEREFNWQRTDPYEGFLHRTYAEAEDIARSKGCVIRSPGPRELFVDLDSESAQDAFMRLFATFSAHESASYQITPSPSGKPGRVHVVVTLCRDVADMRERILLQACLGSDPMRELLSWRRLQEGADADAISLFFEKEP